MSYQARPSIRVARIGTAKWRLCRDMLDHQACGVHVASAGLKSPQCLNDSLDVQEGWVIDITGLRSVRVVLEMPRITERLQQFDKTTSTAYVLQRARPSAICAARKYLTMGHEDRF